MFSPASGTNCICILFVFFRLFDSVMFDEDQKLKEIIFMFSNYNVHFQPYCERGLQFERETATWRINNITWLRKVPPNAGFNSTCYHPPPGHTPGDLQFFSYLAVYSPPPGTQKETISHPRDSSSTTNTLFCVQN